MEDFQKIQEQNVSVNPSVNVNRQNVLLLWATKSILCIYPFFDFQCKKLTFTSAQYFQLAFTIYFITYGTGRYTSLTCTHII